MQIRGVLVSSSNFQSGAIQFASKHGIALIQLTESENRYETRSEFSLQDCLDLKKYKKVSSYVGVMQVSDDNKVYCSYLNNAESKIEEFIIGTNI